MMRLALIGGEEFATGFEDVHAAILSDVAGGKSHGVFLPTCAAHDGLEIVKGWCRKACEKLLPVSASVQTPLVVDTRSANDPQNAALVANADWIYLGGGHPHTGMYILSGTLVMRELRKAAGRGTLILGASAGAMMMCSVSFVITPGPFASGSELEPIDCLGFVPQSMCIPHFNRVFLKHWLRDGKRPQNVTIIGIDEQTALVNTHGFWEVLGHGEVAILEQGSTMRYSAGERISALSSL